MDMTKSNMGGLKLCYGGYTYVKKAKSTNSIRWECSEKKGHVCVGAISTTPDIDAVIGSKREHSHPPCETTTSVMKLRLEIKENSKKRKRKTNQILAEALHGASNDVRAAIGKAETIRRDIRRQKRGVRPKEPKSLAELNLDGVWITTGGADPKPFLIHDSGPDATNRVLVFASDECLRLLANSNHWYMDGTFSLAPKFSKQVYVIRVPFGESAVSCVYALLPGKSQVIYEELFEAINTKVESLGFSVDPTVIITDFEIAATQAIRTTFGDHIVTQGCYYHLTQSTWRKVQDLGLVDIYKANETTRHFCGMLDGLAFLPLDDVTAGMKFLEENTPDGLQDLVSYFNSTYVSGRYRRIRLPAGRDGVVPPIRLRRSEPMFPPEVWNVCQATLDGGDRTNNICEGWNHAFKELIGHKHPSIYYLIEGFQEDHSFVMTAIAQDQIGERLQRRNRRKEKKFNERLMNLCQDRVSNVKNIEQFLTGIGHCIRLK